MTDYIIDSERLSEICKYGNSSDNSAAIDRIAFRVIQHPLSEVLQQERNKLLAAIINHCRERAEECPDDETYTDSEMDTLVEWIEEEYPADKGW